MNLSWSMISLSLSLSDLLQPVHGRSPELGTCRPTTLRFTPLRWDKHNTVQNVWWRRIYTNEPICVSFRLGSCLQNLNTFQFKITSSPPNWNNHPLSEETLCVCVGSHFEWIVDYKRVTQSYPNSGELDSTYGLDKQIDYGVMPTQPSFNAPFAHHTCIFHD